MKLRTAWRLLTALFTAVSMVFGAAAVALADNVSPDGDVATGIQSTLAFGNVCVGQTVTKPLSLAVSRQGGSPINTFANSASVSLSTLSATGAGVAVVSTTPATITLLSDWVSLDNGMLSGSVTRGVTFTPANPGAVTGSVAVLATGANTSNPSRQINRDGTIAVSGTGVNCDTTPPVLTPTITGTTGTNGWYTSNVTVTWAATDPESTATLASGCSNPQTFTAETGSATAVCSATSAGGTTPLMSVPIKIDKTGPTGVTLRPSGTSGTGGWYTSNVSFAMNGTESVSEPVTCQPPATLTSETVGQPVSGQCTNQAGLSTSAAATVKIDKTAPVNVQLNTNGTAGSNGWYVGDVTLTTTGEDAISAVTCTANQQQATETIGQDFNGSCTNGAGLSTNATPRTVKVDKTGPTAALAVTAGTAGANGWYTTDAVVTATGADPISGLASCTGPVTVPGDTSGSTVNGSCTNGAGLSTNAGMLVVKVDETNPTASIWLSGTLGSNNWYTSDVLATTTGRDDVSEPVVCTDPQTVTLETIGSTASGACTNNAGLTQAATSGSFKIDKTAPTDVALSVLSGTEGANGWYTSDVEIHTTGTDTLSGVTCTANQTVRSQGTTIVTSSCTNGAGLTTHAVPMSIKIDKTPPTVNLAVTGDAGSNGWYVGDVTITTNGADDLYGPVNCTAKQTLNEETAETTVTGTCTNEAGLSNSAETTVKIDKTAPGASLDATGSSGENGWYKSAVTVTASGTDSISGPVTCSDPMTLEENTAGTSVGGMCTNDAGLSTNTSPILIKIDMTAPTATLTVTGGNEGDNGWYISPVTVTTSGTSGLSGHTCTDPQTFENDDNEIAVNGLCVNGAGVSANAAPLTIKVDQTNPTISAAISPAKPSLGWYSTEPTVSFTCTDITSGIASCPSSSQVAQGENQTVSGTAKDTAGNTASAEIADIDVDLTDPGINWNGGPAAGATYVFGSVPAAGTCSATDVLSGPNGCNVTGHSTIVGTHNLTATAQDVAGNNTEQHRNYTVGAWTLKGFYQPTDMGNTYNTVKSGSTVPLKWEIFAGPTELTDPTAIASVTAVQFTCGTLPEDAVEEVVVSTTGGTVLRYDTTSGQFVHNWATPKNSPGKCFRITMTTQDSSALSAFFKLK